MAAYLTQAAQGQARLWWDATSIERTLEDPATPPPARQLLALVPAIKAFGGAQGLTPTTSYSQFVDLKRPAVCWVVSAAPALSLQPRTWEFPIVGSVPYLGWFSEQAARDHAESLRGDGWDTDVRPVRAYSTLGFLKDAVLSSMLANTPDAAGELANTILHESVHATLHVGGQATFNESLASFVADALTPGFLEENFGPDSQELLAWNAAEAQGVLAVQQLQQTTQALQQLYAGPLPDDQKLHEKWKRIALLRQHLGIRRHINNATLMQYQTYETGKDTFAAILRNCGNNHPRFLRWLQQQAPRLLATNRAASLAAALQPLTATPCP